jgi:aminoglycoside 2''-phosphotransferase
MTEKEMLQFIQKSIPDLKIHKAESYDSGWDNDILIVNSKIVFRFPKSEVIAAKLKMEGKVLRLLKSKNPILQIPEYEYLYEGSKIKCVKYTFIEGKDLSECYDNKLPHCQDNAKSIGDFLTKLHSINLADITGTNIKNIHTLKYWRNLYDKVRNDIYPFLNDHQQREISSFFECFLEKYPKTTFSKVIIHGDLTVSNMIYCENKGRISGIIDFTDAQLGDPAFDFAGLYWSFGPNFTKDVLTYYKSQEPLDAIFERVSKFYGLQPVFHNLLYEIKNNKSINWDTALDRFFYLLSL